MELSDKITAVGRMQAYIAAHLDEDIAHPRSTINQSGAELTGIR